MPPDRMASATCPAGAARTCSQSGDLALSWANARSALWSEVCWDSTVAITSPRIGSRGLGTNGPWLARSRCCTTAICRGSGVMPLLRPAITQADTGTLADSDGRAERAAASEVAVLPAVEGDGGRDADGTGGRADQPLLGPVRRVEPQQRVAADAAGRGLDQQPGAARAPHGVGPPG